MSVLNMHALIPNILGETFTKPPNCKASYSSPQSSPSETDTNGTTALRCGGLVTTTPVSPLAWDYHGALFSTRARMPIHTFTMHQLHVALRHSNQHISRTLGFSIFPTATLHKL